MNRLALGLLEGDPSGLRRPVTAVAIGETALPCLIDSGAARTRFPEWIPDLNGIELDEDRGILQGWLGEAGFEVVASMPSPSTLRTAMAGRGTPDVVVISGDASTVNNVSRALRGDSVTSGSLLLLAVRETDRPQIDRSLRDDRSVNIWMQGGSAETFAGALQVLTQRAGGGTVTPEDAQRLAAL